MMKKLMILVYICALVLGGVSQAAIPGVTAGNSGSPEGLCNWFTPASAMLDGSGMVGVQHIATSWGQGLALLMNQSGREINDWGAGPMIINADRTAWVPWSQNIDFDLGDTYYLDTMDIWNAGQTAAVQRGIGKCDILTSSDGGATYTALYTEIVLNNAHTLNPGLSDGDYFDKTDSLAMGGVTATHVRIRLYCAQNGGTYAPAGTAVQDDWALSEVRFEGEPLCAANISPADLNGDCIVNLEDFALFSRDWMRCTLISGNCP